MASCLSILIRGYEKYSLIPLLIFGISSVIFGQIETCDNAIDDNNNGLIDLNDPDCICVEIIKMNELLRIIPNPSFELMSCCPETPSATNCLEFWNNGNAGTIDYFNSCGIINLMGNIPPASTPDGSGYIGLADNPSAKESIGTNLFIPLKKDSIYILNIDVGFGSGGSIVQSRSPFELTIYGSPNLESFPINELQCPLNQDGWIILGSVVISGSNEWVKTEIEFIPPENIQSIIIGPNCAKPDQANYYWLDNLILETVPAETRCIARFDINTECGLVKLNSDPTNTCPVQWYRDGIALVGEVDPVHLLDTSLYGAYQLMVIENDRCLVSDPFNFFEPININPSLDTTLCFGSFLSINNEVYNTQGEYLINIPTTDGCNNTLELNLKIRPQLINNIDTTICQGQILQIDNSEFKTKGNYSINLNSISGCDSVINIAIDVIDCFYTPNTFTPNFDGTNDYFTIFSDNQNHLIEEFSIYNRWGDNLFIANNIPLNEQILGWDGASKGVIQPNGVYLYYAKIRMLSGQILSISGDMTLLQ